MNTLGTALPAQMERVTELLTQYVALGSQGAFGALMLKQSLKRATDAYAADDIVAMLHAYEELKACK